MVLVIFYLSSYLLEVCSPQEEHHEIGWVAGEHKIIFYAYFVCIAGHNPIWFQRTLMVVVRLFKRVVLLTSLGKTNAMVCTPGFLWGKSGTAAYKRILMGEGVTFGSGRKPG